MEFTALLQTIERIIDSNGMAVLATVDRDGRPHARWMAPTILRGQPGALYAVTLPQDRKVGQLAQNARVVWLLQSATMEEVTHVHGRATVIDTPSLRAAVLEALGPRLARFWKIHPDISQLDVIETAIDRIEYLRPADGTFDSADSAS